MSDQTDALQVQDAQRQGAKRATLQMLRDKKRRTDDFTADFAGEKASFLFRSIGSTEYDKLITDTPPTLEQKAEGAVYNQDKFAPKLLAKVCVEPELTAAEWTEIWNSPDWSRGEVGNLFWKAVELCNEGLSLTPTEAG